MRCNRVRRFLSRYIDKELASEKVIRLIEAHIDVCSACRGQLKALVSTKELISQQEKVAVPGDFLERLKEKLGPQPQVFRIKWLPQAGELACRLIPVPAVIMLLLFTLVFGRLNGLNPVDEYIFADLSDEEIGILSGYIDNSTLLAKAIFE